MKQSLGDMAKSILPLLNRYKYFLLIMAVGLIFLLWPEPGRGETDVTVPSVSYPAFSVEEMEDKLSRVLSLIDGAGHVDVILSLKSDMEVVYQQDTESSLMREAENGEVTRQQSESRSSTVVTGSGTDAAPVPVNWIYPQYQGALIVCDGADSALVKMAILEAVSGLTGLRADSVTVAKRKS